MEWQPIETAPKDGTEIDLWVEFEDFSGRAENHSWVPKRKMWRYRHGGGVSSENVTHWMPLPEPPK